MIKKNLILFCGCVVILSLFFTSCLSQGVKKVSEEQGYEENSLSIKIETPKYGTIYISGIADKGDSYTRLTVLSYYWFESWAEGWTEVRFAASGNLDLVIDEEEVIAFISSPLTLEYVEDVKIRYRDTIIEGDTGLRQFQGRFDRINAAVLILKDNASLFWDTDREINFPKYTRSGSQEKKGFSYIAEQFFLPEIYGYMDSYISSDKDEKVRVEDVYWNTAYTKKMFPEHFHEVRNSGTWFRDWVEASRLFYMMYMFDELFGQNATGRGIKVIIK